MIKYYCTNYNINDFFERLLSVSSKQTPFAFTYWKMLETLLKPSLKNMLRFPTINTSKALNILNNQPVIIISAGPSFGKNIAWIKENQHNFFIISIGAAVKRLVDEGIKIDLITNVDGDRLIKNQFPDEIRDNIKNIPFITSPTTNEQVLAMFEEKSILLLEAMSGYKDTSFLVPGYSVGEITLNTAYILGAKEIYLIGSDLALDQETGSSHSQGHQLNTTKELTDDIKKQNSFMTAGSFNLSGSTLLVKGNFRNQVITTATFEKSIGAYEVILKRINQNSPKINIYNLNDGAYFEGATPLKIEDIKINSTKITEEQDFTISLENHLFTGFTNEEKINFKSSIKLIDKLIEDLNDLEKIEVNSYEDFNTKRDAILEYIKHDLKKFSRFFLDRLFVNYIFMIEPYLGYQFNDKELSGEINYIKEVKKVWCEHMLIIANKYKEVVSQIFND